MPWYYEITINICPKQAYWVISMVHKALHGPTPAYLLFLLFWYLLVTNILDTYLQYLLEREHLPKLKFVVYTLSWSYLSFLQYISMLLTLSHNIIYTKVWKTREKSYNHITLTNHLFSVVFSPSYICPQVYSIMIQL